MSLNMIFPMTTKNSTSTHKLDNFPLSEKYKHQPINLIPLYKNISGNIHKKKPSLNKNSDQKINEPKKKTNSCSETPNQNILDWSNKDNLNKYTSGDKNNFSSNEKNLRIPLQSIKNNFLARNGILSANLNDKKNKKFKKLLNLGEDKNNNSNYFEKENNENFFKANLEKVRISKKSFGCIEGYSAITTEGIVRGYNEDRVSIILNIPKPQNFKGNDWPKCSFFGIYDGHGGSACADFLRDNLHKFIISDLHFPENPQKAILNGFLLAEKIFIEQAIEDKKKSGSCAIIVLIIEKRCFISNVGDSRAVLSGFNGLKTYSLSKDHRPTEEKEYARIIKAGGKIYQTEANFSKGHNLTENVVGPLRVMPGKLSVSRAFGDIEAKSPLFKGNPNVVIAIPDIKYFDINPNYDFIVIGCDGIFENIKNKELIEIIWKNSYKETLDIHNKCGILVESVINDCINKKFTDNLTVVLISFKELLQGDNNNYATNSQQVNKLPKFIEIKENNLKSKYNLNNLIGEEERETPRNNMNQNNIFNLNDQANKELLENILKKMNENNKIGEKFIPLNYSNVYNTKNSNSNI